MLQSVNENSATAQHDTAVNNGSHLNGSSGHRAPHGEVKVLPSARPSKPVALKVLPGNIPDELTQLAQWVTWRLKWDAKTSRWTKAPTVSGSNIGAKSTDKKTWDVFPACLSAYEMGRADGVGFVLSAADKYTGIDLDGCIDLDTGEFEAAALAIVEALNSYTELSPSGTGLRIIIRAKMPRDENGKTRNRCAASWKRGDEKAEIEIYDTARYLTITGHHFAGTPVTIEKRQAHIEALHADLFPAPRTKTAAPSMPLSLTDNELLEKAFAAKNGGAIRALYNGDAGAYKSLSEAESALCCYLAFYTRDAAQIERIWFSSSLCRDKTKRKDYRARTIANALETVTETYNPVSPQLKRLFAKLQPSRDVAAAEIPAPGLTDDKGNPEYDPAQLRELLHPSWPVQNLTTHAAHAQRIRDHIGGDLCYSSNLGWLVYNERFWQRDDKHATKTSALVATLTQAVRNEGATLYNFAATLAQAGRESDAKAMSKAAVSLLRHTKQIESKAFIEGALHLAAGLLAVETERFDQKPWVIGFQNSTWDKGTWREHRREDYLLYLSPVYLDFEADRSEWAAVLNRITGADLDFAQMAQDVCGYIASAASHLRLLPFFYGPKGTGKSTVAELLQTVLGDMAATIDPKKLQDSAARERLGADLWNRRLATCSEAGSQRLEAELLKTLSGGDRLAVRFLFREAFTAPPRHVLLMVTNDPPKMDAYDAALKDRVIALPFVHPLDNGAPLELTGGKRIEAVRQDPNSPLVRGFAAWMMEGLARVWQSQEIYRAKCAETATAQFWADTDQLTTFWETIEESTLLSGIAKTDLRKQYEAWCEAEGARPFNRSQWARACKSHNLEDEQRTGGKRFWFLPKVAQVAQKGTFSKDTREVPKVPRIQFENKGSCATCATTIADNDEPEAF